MERRLVITPVPRWLLLGARGAAWLPNRGWYADDLVSPQKELTINHESIHLIQQVECSPVKDVWTWRGYFLWIVAYLCQFAINRYDKNIFEIDAYKHQSDIKNRPPKAWRKV